MSLPQSDPRYGALQAWKPPLTYGDRRGEFIVYRVTSHLGQVIWESRLLTFGEWRSYPGVLFPRERLRNSQSTLTYYIYMPSFSFQATVRVRRSVRPSGSGLLLFIYAPDASYGPIVNKLRGQSPRAGKQPRSRYRSSSLSNVRKNPETYTTTYVGRFWTNTGVDQTTSHPFTTFNRTWTGTRTPNFQTLKEKGQLPVNNHVVSLVSKDMGACWQRVWNYTGAWQERIFPWAALWPEPTGAAHLSGLQFTALRRLINRAETGMSANLSQDIVQISQTTRMIANTVMRLTKAIRAVKQGNLKYAAALLYDPRSRMLNRRAQPRPGLGTAKNWLELQYGWKPLLYDIRGSMEAIARMNLDDRRVRRATSSATKVQVDRVPFNVTTMGVTSKPSGVHISETISTFRYGIWFSLDDRLTAFLAQTGFTNPINLAWEILPYSFVVDWFLPIGPYLETLHAWKGMHFVDGYSTQFTRQDTYSVVYRSSDESAAPFWSKTSMKGTYARTTVLLNRAKLTQFPSARFPEFKNPLSVTHALNGLALLRAAFVPRGHRTYHL